MVKVRGVAFQLHEAAAIARLGGEQLQQGKAAVLEAVNEALLIPPPTERQLLTRRVVTR